MRTPLGAIQGYINLALREKDLSPAITQSLGSMQRNSEHLLTLVNDFLDISKIEAGLLEIDQRSFSPKALVMEIEDSLTPEARKKGLDLQTTIDKSLPPILHSDPHRIRQILINLIGNSIKFTPAGRVTISQSFTRQEDQKGLYQVTIEDTGIGMMQEQKERLFKPFSQGDREISRKYGGTGLGLSLSKRLANLLGGELTLTRSAPGEGSLFTLIIPCGFSIEPARGIDHESLDRPPSKEILAGIRVLVVEDCEDNQYLYREFLESQGAKTTIAEDGYIAQILAQNQSFDLILMDIQLPNLDGYATTKELRAMGVDSPIIALTAHAMLGEKKRCLDAGCNDYLTKPIDCDYLIHTVASYCKRLPREQRSAAIKSIHKSIANKTNPIFSILDSDPRIQAHLPNFIKGLEKRGRDLKAAYEQKDLNKIQRLAHQLIGSAANYGFPGLKDLAKELESQCQENPHDLNEAVEKVLSYLGRIKERTLAKETG